MIQFHADLSRVINMLVLAAATFSKMRAIRISTFFCGLYNFNQPCPGKIALTFCDFNQSLLARNDKWHKDNQSICSCHARSTKGNIGDLHLQLVTGLRAFWRVDSILHGVVRALLDDVLGSDLRLVVLADVFA